MKDVWVIMGNYKYFILCILLPLTLIEYFSIFIKNFSIENCNSDTGANFSSEQCSFESNYFEDKGNDQCCHKISSVVVFITKVKQSTNFELKIKVKTAPKITSSFTNVSFQLTFKINHSVNSMPSQNAPLLI